VQAQQETALATARAEADERLESLKVKHEAALAAAQAQVQAQSEAGAAKADGQQRVEMLSKMLREQQAELSDGYRLSATIKLTAAMDKHVTLSLATAWALWRQGVALAELHSTSAATPSTATSDAATVAMQAEVASLAKQLSAATEAANDLTKTRDEAVASNLKVRADAMRAKSDAEREKSDLRADLQRATEAASQATARLNEQQEAATRPASGSQQKVEALSRMLREQQAEISDGYRLCAAIKLGSAVDKRVTLSLATAWTSWRLHAALVDDSCWAATDSVSLNSSLQSRPADRTRDSDLALDDTLDLSASFGELDDLRLDAVRPPAGRLRGHGAH